MRLQHFILAGSLCLPFVAMAQQSPPASPPAVLQGLVSEEDVAALFDYLRNALIAASEGRAAPMPDELRQRLEMLGADLKLRGTIGGLLLLKSLEAEVKQWLRETPPAAPAVPHPSSSPYERSSARL